VDSTHCAAQAATLESSVATMCSAFLDFLPQSPRASVRESVSGISGITCPTSGP